jgi:hypothetical protein
MISSGLEDAAAFEVAEWLAELVLQPQKAKEQAAKAAEVANWRREMAPERP